MKQNQEKITVYYDGACPSCIKDRESYEKMAGKAGEDVCWFDISGKDVQLRELGIDPYKAMTELHVRNERQEVLSEIDAYILRPLQNHRFHKTQEGTHNFNWICPFFYRFLEKNPFFIANSSLFRAFFCYFLFRRRIPPVASNFQQIT